MPTVTVGVGFIKTLQGILKSLEILVCFIGLLLVAIDGWLEALLNAYIVGIVIGFIISLLLLILHITKVASPMAGILSYQLYVHIFLVIYLLIVSSIILSRHYRNTLMAGGGFGIIASILYLVDAIDCYRNDSTVLFCLRR